MENATLKQKMVGALKRYGYYLLLGVLVLGAILTMVIIGGKSSKNKTTPTSTTVSPYMPVLNATL